MNPRHQRSLDGVFEQRGIAGGDALQASRVEKAGESLWG